MDKIMNNSFFSMGVRKTMDNQTEVQKIKKFQDNLSCFLNCPHYGLLNISLNVI